MTESNPAAADNTRAGGKCGHLFIVSAPSGAGKTTLCQAVLTQFPDMAYSVSHTTRRPRCAERDGVDYFFISVDKFEEMIALNQWAEWAEVHGHYYGTSAKFIDTCLRAGRDILLDIDVQGTFKILERFPGSITIFIMAPSMKVLGERLIKRGTDDKDEIDRRLAQAQAEISQRHRYRHQIVNHVLPVAVNELCDLIRGYRQTHRTLERPPEKATSRPGPRNGTRREN